DANAERKTRAGCAVDTGNIRRPPDVTNAAPQHGPRSAEQEPVVYPSNRERIEAAMKVEHAVASRAADYPAALVDHERNAADIGVCALETDAEQSDQRDQRASEQDQNSHGLDPPCDSELHLRWPLDGQVNSDRELATARRSNTQVLIHS